MQDTVEFLALSKHNEFLGQFQALESTTTLSCIDAHTSVFSLDDDHRILSDLLSDGARCQVRVKGERVMEGRVISTPGEGPEGQITATIVDDFDDVAQMLAWPKSTAAITAQTDEYAQFSGVSETIVKQVVSAQVSRLGRSWGVVPSAGRGSAGRVNLRFHTLADKVLPLLATDRLFASLTRVDPVPATGAKYLFDVHQGRTTPQTLTLESGIVDAYSYLRSVPTATRVVIGGMGQGVERKFMTFVDAAREARFGFIREVFVDARNTGEDDNLADDGREALAESDAKSAVTLDIVESSWFQFLEPNGYRLGDRIVTALHPIEVTDWITKVTITESVEAGLQIVPTIGINSAGESTDAALYGLLSKLAAGQRRNEKS